jgi:hypothetical protein
MLRALLLCGTMATAGAVRENIVFILTVRACLATLGPLIALWSHIPILLEHTHTHTHTRTRTRTHRRRLMGVLGLCCAVLQDDQDIELNERLDSPLGPMQHTKTLMQEAGALGTHSYVNVPICCPSRSNILSGRYAHNIRDNHYEPFPPNGMDPSGVAGHSCGDEPIEQVTCLPATPKCLPCGCMRMNVSSLGEFPEQTYPVYLKRAGCEYL